MFSSKTHYADKCYGFSEERVICRWKCSLWKLAWKQFILYFTFFVTISLFYRRVDDIYILWGNFAHFEILIRKVCSEDQQKEFEKLIHWARYNIALY